jgi:nitroreductase
MDVYEAMEKRRTIRSFTEPATEEALKKIIMAGTLAASPMNWQAWEFIVVDDPNLIEEIAQHKYLQNEKTFKGSGADRKTPTKTAVSLLCVPRRCTKTSWPPGCVYRTCISPPRRKAWALCLPNYGKKIVRQWKNCSDCRRITGWPPWCLSASKKVIPTFPRSSVVRSGVGCIATIMEPNLNNRGRSV